MRIKHWDNFSFIVGYHLLLILLIPAFIKHFHWSSLVLFAVAFILAGGSGILGYIVGWIIIPEAPPKQQPN